MDSVRHILGYEDTMRTVHKRKTQRTNEYCKYYQNNFIIKFNPFGKILFINFNGRLSNLVLQNIFAILIYVNNLIINVYILFFGSLISIIRVKKICI